MRHHLRGHRSTRGLLYMPALTEDYGGEVRVYESSAAERPCVWLRVTRSDTVSAETAHLTAEAAWELAEQIRYVLRHHYQCDAMPDVAEELKERVERIVADVQDSDPQGWAGYPIDIADRLATAGLLADPLDGDEHCDWSAAPVREDPWSTTTPPVDYPWEPGDPVYPAPPPEPEVRTFCASCGQSFRGELDRCPNGCPWETDEGMDEG